MSFTCYWGLMSQPSRALKAFLDDSGIPFESRHVDMLKMENYSPEITKLSPGGLLPFLSVDGQVYTETVALMRYLACKYPEESGRFYPPGLEERYQIDKWCDFYSTSFRPAFVREQGAKYTCLMERRERDDKDQFVIDTARKNQIKAMRSLEAQLDAVGGKFVLGDELTLADYLLFSQMQDLRLLSLQPSDYSRAMQYEADVLATSAGLAEIHRAGGVYETEVLPAAQQLMK